MHVQHEARGEKVAGHESSCLILQCPHGIIIQYIILRFYTDGGFTSRVVVGNVLYDGMGSVDHSSDPGLQPRYQETTQQDLCWVVHQQREGDGAQNGRLTKDDFQNRNP